MSDKKSVLVIIILLSVFFITDLVCGDKKDFRYKINTVGDLNNFFTNVIIAKDEAGKVNSSKKSFCYSVKMQSLFYGLRVFDTKEKKIIPVYRDGNFDEKIKLKSFTIKQNCIIYGNQEKEYKSIREFMDILNNHFFGPNEKQFYSAFVDRSQYVIKLLSINSLYDCPDNSELTNFINDEKIKNNEILFSEELSTENYNKVIDTVLQYDKSGLEGKNIYEITGEEKSKINTEEELKKLYQNKFCLVKERINLSDEPEGAGKIAGDENSSKKDLTQSQIIERLGLPKNSKLSQNDDKSIHHYDHPPKMSWQEKFGLWKEKLKSLAAFGGVPALAIFCALSLGSKYSLRKKLGISLAVGGTVYGAVLGLSNFLFPSDDGKMRWY